MELKCMKGVGIKNILAILLLFIGHQGLAGVGSSGGGAGVVCRDANDAIVSVETLDLFDAKAKGLNLISSSGDLEKDYWAAILSLRKTIGDNRPVSQEDRDSFTKNLNSLKFTKPGHEIDRLYDEGDHAPIPSGCLIEQIAVWHEPMNIVEVSIDLWNKLGALDRAALMIHEPIYEMQRRSGAVTSHETRRLVGRIFSENGLAPEDAGLLTDVFYCGAVTAANTTDGLTLRIFRDMSKPRAVMMKVDDFMGQSLSLPAEEISSGFGIDDLRMDYNGVVPFIVKLTKPNVNETLKVRLSSVIQGIAGLEFEFKTGAGIKINMINSNGDAIGIAGVIACNRTGFEY